jgi:hypothetical protein
MGKMAIDALGHDEEDANTALEEILESPRRLEDLDLDALAEEPESEMCHLTRYHRAERKQSVFECCLKRTLLETNRPSFFLLWRFESERVFVIQSLEHRSRYNGTVESRDNNRLSVIY